MSLFVYGFLNYDYFNVVLILMYILMFVIDSYFSLEKDVMLKLVGKV